jgi:hypothetical protein
MERAMRVAKDDQRRVLADISRAQRAAGISDEVIARACDTSRWTVARIIGGTQPASAIALAAIGGAVGLDVRLRAYPAGDPIRDAGQQRLLDRFRRRLHVGINITTEAPLGIEGDLRAWDAMLRTRAWRRPVEAETVIDDVQAQERRLRLKMRDGGMDGVILVISDTRRNRAAIAAAPSAFIDFDRNARRVLAELRAGRDPGGSALLFL